MEKMYAEKPGWLPTVFRELRELIMFNLYFNYLMSYPNCHNSSVLNQAGFCYLVNCCEHHDDLSLLGFTVYKNSLSVMVVMRQKEAERAGR